MALVIMAIDGVARVLRSSSVFVSEAKTCLLAVAGRQLLTVCRQGQMCRGVTLLREVGSCILSRIVFKNCGALRVIYSQWS